MKKLILMLLSVVFLQSLYAQEYTQYYVTGTEAAANGDMQKAVSEWTKGANLNDKYCCGRLGVIYLMGFGIPKNESEGLKWAFKGYQLGNSYAAGMLGMYYIMTDPDSKVSQDKALKCLEFSYLADDAEKDNVEMYGNIGATLATFHMMQGNNEKALEWANRTLIDYPDYPQANGLCAFLYYFTEDYNKAVKYATIADKSDNLYGTYILGLCMAYGHGMVKNETAGFKKIRKVAYTETMDDAMYELGNMLYNGIGTTPDKDEAKKWFQKAAALGHPSASEKLNMLY